MKDLGFTSRGTGLFQVLIAAELMVALSLGTYMLWQGNGNLDEGWYLFAGQRVYQGALPYRDFAFFQTPLSAFVYGIPSVFGLRAVMGGEAISLVLMLVTLGVAMRVACVHGGRVAALLVPPLLLNPLTLWAFTSVRTEPVSTLLLTLIAYFLLEGDSTPKRAALACVTAVLAVLARLSMVPMMLLVVGWSLYRFRGNRSVMRVFAAGGLVIALGCVGMVWVTGPDDIWFGLVLSQAERSSQLAAVPFSIARFLFSKILALFTVALQFPVAFVTGAAGCVWMGAEVHSRARRGWLAGVISDPLIVLFGLGMVSYLPQLAPRNTFDIYFVPSTATIAIAIAIVVGRWSASQPRQVLVRLALLGLGVLQVLLFMEGEVGFALFHRIVPASVKSRFSRSALYVQGADTDHHRLHTLARVVEEMTPSDRQVVTLDLGVALEAHRVVPDELSMGVFAYYPRLTDVAARENGVVNERLFRALFQRPEVGTIVLNDLVLGFMFRRNWSGFEPTRSLSEAELQQLLPELSAFRLAYTGLSIRNAPGPAYVLVRQ